MKRLFFALTALLLVTSCAKDATTMPAVVEGESVVSFKISAPEISTRYGEGTTANKLFYAVYQNDKLMEEVSALESADAVDINITADVKIKLVSGLTYKILFWAQNENAPYEFDGAKVTINPTLKANEEAYDAFFRNYEAVINGTTPHYVELYRPFAQLNIGTNDIEEAKDAAFELKNTAVKVKTNTVLDLTSGAASQPVELTYALNTKADDTYEGYDIIAMNYLLVGNNGKELVDVTFEAEDNASKKITRSYTNVPVERNHKTYLLGEILTTTSLFNVVIIPGFDGILPETAEEKLALAAQLGGVVTLTEDAVLTKPLVVSKDAVLTIDLAGHTISQQQVQTGAYSMIENRGTLTLKNSGTIEYADNATLTATANYVSNTIQNSGTLIIEEGVEVVNNSDLSVSKYGYPHAIDNSGTLTINGGTFTNNTNYSSMRIWCTTDDNTVVTINGGTFNGSIDFQNVNDQANKGTLTINDGTFNADTYTNSAVRLLGFGTDVDEMNAYINGGKFNGLVKRNNYVDGEFNSQVFYISGGTFANDPSEFVAEGYHVNKVGDDYVVNDYILTADTEGLQAALDAAKEGEIIHLTAGVNYGVVYMGRPTKSNNTVMYCGTHDFTTTDAAAFAAHLAEAGYHTTPYYTTTLKNITIVGAEGATVAGVVATSGHAYGDVYDYVLDKDYDIGSAYCAILHMENIKFQNVAFTGKIDINTSQEESTYNGVTFEGCTFTTGGTDSTNGAAIRYYNESTTNGHVKNIVVKNCEFNNCYQGVYVQNVNGVTVTDNEFDTTGHNAVAVQGVGDLKAVVIENNTFNNIGDRVIRFNNVGADSQITIQHNTATNSGNGNGEVIKAETIAAGVTTNVGYNNWNGGVVVNPELRDTTTEVSTSDAIKTILATETDGVTIVLTAGTYEGLSFTNPANFKAKNVTIVGQDDAEIKGFSVNGWSATDNIEIDGLTFKNIKFSSGLLLSTKSMANVVVEECDFINDACIHQNDKTESLTNLEVKNCTFTGVAGGNTTAVMLENTNNVTVVGCDFTNIDYNVMQAGILTGTVLFDNNTVNGTGDRVFRFVDTSSVDITISNNTIVSNGDADGELAKASNPVAITLTNNTWNGKTDAEVADKLINITAK